MRSTPFRSRTAAGLLAAALATPLAGPLAAQAPQSTAAAAPAARRPLRVDDLFRVRDVRDPQRSPDGAWVSYTVGTSDSARDRNDSDVWMTSWDGAQTIRLTSTPDGESSARWSPDNKYLSFLSSRSMGSGAVAGSPGSGAQLWLLNRAGGEAQKLTDFRGGVSDYEWSPDGKRIAFIIEDDPDTAATRPGAGADSTRRRAAKPIVIDRYAFKRDVVGYLGGKRQRVYIYDVEAKKAQLLTSGPAFDESDVSWSPDGKYVAFVSKRGEGDVDRNQNTEIWIAEARGGAALKQITNYPGRDNSPAWSPDGRYIAYVRGGDPKYMAYDMGRLAVVDVAACMATAPAGCTPRILTEELDRAAGGPRWAPDGALLFTVTDDRTRWVGRVRPAGGKVERLTSGPRVVSALAPGKDGKMVALVATDSTLPEVYALEGGAKNAGGPLAMRRLTKQNDEWLSQVRLSTVEDFTSRSKDGTEVHSLLAKPAGAAPGAKLPLLLRIHGGPNGQDEHSFSFERELFAANGYAVLNVNYRGGAGRGEKYQTAIYGDWGNLEVVDLLGAVDAAVAAGVADPNRLGIGGWSYGGILTDYTIATDQRFKAAISGAGSAMQMAMYGADQYIVQYETELGLPWKNPEPWMKVSYPFFHADRITTPTLFMVGERDFNVPAIGSEQMYQALRSLGVETQLVIYPGQFHGISLPSYRKDRLERYLAWYDKYLKPRTTAAAATTSDAK